jgi:molecular chaperone HtpG
LTEYKGKQLKAADRGEIKSEGITEEKRKQFEPLLAFLKEKLGEIKEARLSSRLKESAACLVADEWAMGAHMERLMQRMGRAGDMPASKRILEINPDHPAVEAMRKVLGRDPADDRLIKYSRLLHDEAVLAEGSRLKDPAGFSRLINELVVRDAGT